MWYTQFSVSSRIVLIGPADSLPALQERFSPGTDVQTFTDSEALEALDHIIRTKPAMVAMHDEFAASSRGAALINRIKDDPSLDACEVRVLARDSEVSRVTARIVSMRSRLAIVAPLLVRTVTSTVTSRDSA